MTERNRIPERIQRLFWDVKKEDADIDLHRSYIIRRIIDHGNLDDVKWMKEAYSPDEIVEVVKRSKGLSRRSAWFWSAYYDIPPEEIECLKTPLMEQQKVDFGEIEIAEWRDVVVEKMKTIAQRGSKKDFYDVYSAIAPGRLSIEEVAVLFLRRFESRGLNFYHVLRSLTYFEDADQEPDIVALEGHTFPWEDVKSFFRRNVREFEKHLTENKSR